LAPHNPLPNLKDLLERVKRVKKTWAHQLGKPLRKVHQGFNPKLKLFMTQSLVVVSNSFNPEDGQKASLSPSPWGNLTKIDRLTHIVESIDIKRSYEIPQVIKHEVITRAYFNLSITF